MSYEVLCSINLLIQSPLCENSARFTRTVAFTATKLAHHLKDLTAIVSQLASVCILFVKDGGKGKVARIYVLLL